MSVKSEPMQPITVRFTGQAYEAIGDIAKDNGVSKAEIVRMAAAGNLLDYLGVIRIVDKQDSAEIRSRIAELFDTASGIETELRKIGVNFNQYVKLKNTELKQTGRVTGVGQGGNVLLSGPDLISRYEAATREVGEALCRILT